MACCVPEPLLSLDSLKTKTRAPRWLSLSSGAAVGSWGAYPEWTALRLSWPSTTVTRVPASTPTVWVLWVEERAHLLGILKAVSRGTAFECQVMVDTGPAHSGSLKVDKPALFLRPVIWYQISLSYQTWQSWSSGWHTVQASRVLDTVAAGWVSLRPELAPLLSVRYEWASTVWRWVCWEQSQTEVPLKPQYKML